MEVLLLFSDASKMIEWRKVLGPESTRLQNFCLAFSHKQALVLLKELTNIKVIFGEKELFDRALATEDSEAFFSFLAALTTQTLILPMPEDRGRKSRKYTQVRAAVLGHVRTTRAQNKARREVLFS